MSEQHEGATGAAEEEPHEMTREEKVADIKQRLDNMRVNSPLAPIAAVLHDVFELMNPSSGPAGPSASSTQAHGAPGATGPAERSVPRR